MKLLTFTLFGLAIARSFSAEAATVIDLGSLGAASGSTTFLEASSYNDADVHTVRFLFTTSSPGTLSIGLAYQQEVRSTLREVCPDPTDPSSCFVEPTGDYQDYAGVDLRKLALGLEGAAVSETALPSGFQSLITGGAGEGIPSFGFDFITYDFDLGQEFAVSSTGSHFADLTGFGLIRGPDFPGEGGGSVQYTFSFEPLAASIPEPATWMMMIFGLVLVGAAVRRSEAARMVRASGRSLARST